MKHIFGSLVYFIFYQFQQLNILILRKINSYCETQFYSCSKILSLSIRLEGAKGYLHADFFDTFFSNFFRKSIV